MNIRDELTTEKEFTWYMESRFKRIFVEPPIEEEKNIEMEQSGEADGEGARRRLSQQQWNTQEKALLIELLKKYGRDWTTIAEFFPRKTDKQCRNYF